MTGTVQVWGDVSNPLHIQRLRRFAQLGIGETVRRDGAFAVVTGAVSNIENGVVSERADVEPAVAEELVAWVRSRELPACWAAEIAVDERLHDTLVGLGCREETTGVDMGARLAELELADGDTELEEVRDPARLRDWIEVANAAGLFDDDEQVRREQERLYGRAGIDLPFRHWLARRNGRAIGIATGFFNGDAALLEHLAVRPEEQRRGVGTALVARWRRDALALGCEVGALGPTPDSQAFYERLGFTLTRVRPRRWYYLP